MKLFKEILTITAIIIVIGAIYFLTHNFDINNLILISRKQLRILNQNYLIKDDPELTKSGIILADLLIKINEKDKEIKKNGED